MKKEICLICLAVMAACSVKNEVYVEAIPRDIVINPFGPPRSKTSFGKGALVVGHQKYEHGLGVHAPSMLDISLDGRAKRFMAVVGVDQEIRQVFYPNSAKKVIYFPHYVYGINSDKTFDGQNFRQGGTVCFRVLLDGREAFNSGLVTLGSDPVNVDIDLTGAGLMQLIVEDAGDGCNIDHADWADARIQLNSSSDARVLKMFHQPRHISLNHVGYMPNVSKVFTLSGMGADSFVVVKVRDSSAAYKGRLFAHNGDFGSYLQGDFSMVNDTGLFYISVPGLASDTFRIHPLVYEPVIDRILNYHSLQRCGHPKGWNGACHTDDGTDIETGKHADMTGGWHDACDLRKMTYDITMLEGLSYFGIKVKNESFRLRILDELRWGNRFFLKMQHADGYYMERFGHQLADNRFTDNRVGTADDRKLYANPADVYMQVSYIMAQACCARFAATIDPAFSRKCLEASEKCYRWISLKRLPLVTSTNYAGMAVACLQLYSLTKKEQYRTDKVSYLDSLLAMQNTENASPSGYFYSKPGNPEPLRDIFKSNYYLSNLALLYKECSDDNVRARCVKSLESYCTRYVLPFAALTPFGIVPMGIYSTDPGGSRRMGNYYYRWFWENNERQDIWWNGTNPHILASGAGLALASDVLHNQALKTLAQRQLDWVFGHNPFNASFVTSIGYHQPPLFKTGEFSPVTPDLPGGGMAGIGSDNNDIPLLCPGWWNTCEYWGPVNSNILWLLAELQYD